MSLRAESEAKAKISEVQEKQIADSNERLARLHAIQTDIRGNMKKIAKLVKPEQAKTILAYCDNTHVTNK